MRLLILLTLFVSSITFSNADIRVTVTMEDGQSPCLGKCDFKTQEKADAWIADNLSNDSWGKPERWVKFEDQENCLETRDILDENDDVIGGESKLPKQYSIVVSDITAEVEAQKAKEDADKLKIDELKLKDKEMKLDELIELLKLKGLI